MKAVAPTPGSKYRIKVGQTITGICWSNAATTIKGFWTIVYDDGDPDYWPIVESASGSSRAAVLWSTGQVAKKNGWVVGGVAGGGGTFQRGQLYHQVLITDVNLSVSSEVIACGYAYAGHLVEFGTFVEPGPAGGHGAMRSIGLGTPALGAEYSDLTVATGAIWRIHGMFGQLVTAATAANREFTFGVTDGTRTEHAAVAGEIQTATITNDYYGLTGGVSSSGVSAALAGGAVQIGLGYMLAGGGVFTIIRFKTYNIQAGDQWGAGFVSVEEWVMPN